MVNEETIVALIREALAESKTVQETECVITRGDAMLAYLLATLIIELRA